MSDRMRVIPFDKLMKWILAENEREGSIFGVPSERFFRKSNDRFSELFGETMETPIGPAAGPHTQLAQNIIAAYLTGSRFFELKTVQVLDGEDLPVSKPCISAQDEGYNVEWSTELTVSDAFNEYVKAWFALNILAKELTLGSNNGFIFNMSVGYDLAGIMTLKIDVFIEGLKDASRTPIWQECREFILNNLELFKRITPEDIEEISPNICSSITLSTLHGCPPEEIERIAKYLMEEKKLHTFVKCNPTLLGYQFTRDLLDKMGYDYLTFDDHHFRNDLQFADAFPMIARLQDFAKERNLTFGVKLSNTFPVKITNNLLPGEEMYMSGRALYPLTINLAYRLAKEFKGDLKISYSGGADFFNLEKIYQTGIWPITLATTILKPGGYLRFKQIAELLGKVEPALTVNLDKLKELAESAAGDPNHLKDTRTVENRKIGQKLPLTDCFPAPCTNGCPIGQDIPEYIRLAGEGRYLEALEVIVAKNPLPFITGTLCNHRCMTKCTRLDYEAAVNIRNVKLLAAEKAFDELINRIEPPVINSNFKVAIIGAGPAGLAAGYFLGQKGIEVCIFDKKDQPGGIIEHIAPSFRISKKAINNDLDLVKKMGVQFRLGMDENFSITELKKQGFKYILIAIGAWKPGQLKLEANDREIINVLEFLEAFNKNPDTLQIGQRIAVIGAGNSAMDAARAAKRVPGVEDVYLIYRRTRKYMPADPEELRLAMDEGVEFKELLVPVAFANGILKCQRMRVGTPDNNGRRITEPVPGEFIELPVDNVIAAVGEKINTELLTRNGLELGNKGWIEVNPETNETNIAGVFIGGDTLRGPATIVEAIADGTRFAKEVLARENKDNLNPDRKSKNKNRIKEIGIKKGVLQPAGNPANENNRCLECDLVCNICVEVCPNRANFQVKVSDGNLNCSNQILHLDGMCNECGNCQTFCPYQGAPYQDKFTLFRNKADFDDSRNAGFLLTDAAANRFEVRLDDNTVTVEFDRTGKCNGAIPKEIEVLIWSAYQNYRYLFV